MKEIYDIINSYKKAKALSLETVLATVVKVEGSSYRQPGARMLVTEFGEITGAISGGCLEGDALKRALLAIDQKQNKLITYDTSDPNNTEFAVHLGCNGIVHILFEYIDSEKIENPIYYLEKTLNSRQNSILAVGFNLDKSQKQTGHYLHLSENSNSNPTEIVEVFNKKKSLLTDSLLLNFVPKPTQLIIAGAGNDVQPLVEAASIFGWKIIVAEGRASHTKISRFPKATEVIQTSAEDFLNHFQVDSETFVVLMTHNYKYDLTLLQKFLFTSVPYIGVLGPKSKMERMISELNIELSSEQIQKIYGPVGLDLGAETSEEIALSILAEIQAVKMKTNADFLRNKKGKIHETS